MWQGLLGRRPDWGIGPPRSTGVRKGCLSGYRNTDAERHQFVAAVGALKTSLRGRAGWGLQRCQDRAPAPHERSSLSKDLPRPCIPGNQSSEHEAHNDQEVVEYGLVRKADEIENDQKCGCDDVNPSNCGIRHRER